MGNSGTKKLLAYLFMFGGLYLIIFNSTREVIGAVLLVGGIILSYLPEKD